jgi:hypothetical protein
MSARDADHYTTGDMGAKEKHGLYTVWPRYTGGIPGPYYNSPYSLSPLPWVRATPRSTPLSGRLGLRVSSVKLKTLNVFYGHFRSFAHPKPYIKNYQRKKIYNPVLIFFRYQKTCLLVGKSPKFLILHAILYLN